ncbi:hypothetical protein [Micromonospora sp. NPDC126480]|uniref:hypothetical protein n=1 Tax=Micromonospora sp. NPDC126480 TaxID=3155312 RepID=UPI003323C9CD
MTDCRADGTVAPVPAIRLRLVVTALTSAVVGPVLLLYAWLLVWYSPEITNPGGCPNESPSRGPGNGTLVWVLACAAGVAGALCLGIALARTNKYRGWWPWLLAGVVILAAGSPAVAGLPAAAWCPPLP